MWNEIVWSFVVETLCTNLYDNYINLWHVDIFAVEYIHVDFVWRWPLIFTCQNLLSTRDSRTKKNVWILKKSLLFQLFHLFEQKLQFTTSSEMETIEIVAIVSSSVVVCLCLSCCGAYYAYKKCRSNWRI